MKWRHIGFEEMLGLLMMIGLVLMFVYEFTVGFDLGFRFSDTNV